MMWLLLGDLSSWGYTAGAVKFYEMRGYDGITYYVIDTVAQVELWDGSGSRCTFSPPIERALFWTYLTTYSYYWDSAHAYYDGTYLIDFGGSEDWPALFGAYLRVLKFPLVVGDTWQAIDTCQFLPGERVPYMDEDSDGFVDSLYYDTSYATLVSVSGDTAEVYIYPAVFGKVYTGTAYSGDTLLCCSQEIYEFYLRFKYLYGIGMVFLSIDSIMVYSAFKLIDTTTWDTTVVPPTLVFKFDNYQRWRYTTVGVLERARGPVEISVRGRLLKVEEDAQVFGADGRLVAILDRGQSALLRPGVYFVRTRRGVKKVVVR